jgi:glucose-1-phosphate thymidylyltransferase
MKALILAGGKGTRLRPLTYTSAKQLIPIANKPTIEYGIEAIVGAGITEIGIIVGETKDEIIHALGDGSRYGAQFSYIEQDQPRGLAHAVMIAEEFMGGDSFLMYLGDNIVRGGVKGFVEQFIKQAPNSMVLLNRVPNPSSYGVVELVDGKVHRLIEKPKDPPSDLALVGVYLFDQSIFKAVNSIKPSERNELEITEAIQWLVDQGFHVHPHVIESWWKDTGRADDMLEANRIMLEGLSGKIDGEVCPKSSVSPTVQIGTGSRVVNATIRGPAIIGCNVEITNAYVGPFTSIGDHVSISGSEIENSIVMESVRISDVEPRLDSCLLGKGVVIRPGDRRPRSVSLVLGDNSSVQL